MPVSTSASGRLGVTRSARGRRSRANASRASSRRSGAPPLATITGSTTNRSTPCSPRALATDRTISAENSMPVFTASAPMSESTLRIWAPTASGSTGNTPWTPTEFWAVTAVRAELPWHPSRAKVLRSAWMPAPPPESDPATVSTRGGAVSALMKNSSSFVRWNRYYESVG